VRDRLIARAAARSDWVLGWQDETWWTRLAQPDLFAWAGDQPLRLLPNERGGGPEALACYGLLRADTGAMLLRFVEGRPVSQVTEDFLGWLCAVRGRRQARVRAGLGQRRRARQPAGAALDRGAQPAGEARRRLQDSGVLLAGEGAVAEPD
jgi:hypothetical protein